MSNRLKTDDTLVIVEAGIDALSHFVIHEQQHQKNHRRYISIGGEPSPEAWNVTIRILEKFMTKGGAVVCGVDNDAAGDRLHEKLGAKTKITISRERSVLKDWNEDLMNSLTS